MISQERLFYTSGEMANMCGVHPRTWCRWVQNNEAPQADLVINGCPKWSKELVEAWLDKGRKRRRAKLNDAAKKRV